MSEPKDSEPVTYNMGNVGSGANVQQGHHLNMNVESDSLKAVFTGMESVRQKLLADRSLSEPDKKVSVKKIDELEAALQNAANDPETLHLTLLDTESWLTRVADWAWTGVRDSLKGDVGQKVIAGIAEGTAKGAIEAILKH